MEDKENLVLKFLSRLEAPISFNELEKGLKEHFDKNKKETLLTCVSNLEWKGLLDDNYAKGIKITEDGKKHLDIGGVNQENEQPDHGVKRKPAKRDYDQKAPGFVYRTYWLMFAISIVALILSILSVLLWFFPRLRQVLLPFLCLLLLPYETWV